MIDREYAQAIRQLMPPGRKGERNDTPVSTWKELDRIHGVPEKTAVVIFRTTGCAWYRFSSCSMCGYFNDVASDVSAEDLMKQIDRAYNALNGEEVIKVFTSGSFLDPREFPMEARRYFFERFSGTIDRFLIESRTEYITEGNLADVSALGSRVRIAIGLESANDRIIEKSINKGSTFSKFVEAAGIVNKLGMELRAYLLLKPPFISEKDAIDDIVESVRKIRGMVTDASINPMNIQKNTMVESLWKRGLYRPPRLWSVAKALLDSSGLGTEVVSYPTGGNRERGAHNDTYDPKLLNLIVDSSLNQDFSELREYFVSSDKGKWEKDLDNENKLIMQMDYGSFARRMSSSSITV